MKIYQAAGFTGNLKQFAKHFDIPYSTLRYRVNNLKMSLEDALVYSKNVKYTVGNFTGTLPQMAEHFGLSYNTLQLHRSMGMSVEEAVKRKRSHRMAK